MQNEAWWTSDVGCIRNGSGTTWAAGVSRCVVNIALVKHCMHIVCSHDSVSGTSNTARQIGQMTESMEIGGGGVKKTSRSRY